VPARGPTGATISSLPSLYGSSLSSLIARERGSLSDLFQPLPRPFCAPVRTREPTASASFSEVGPNQQAERVGVASPTAARVREGHLGHRGPGGAAGGDAAGGASCRRSPTVPSPGAGGLHVGRTGLPDAPDKRHPQLLFQTVVVDLTQLWGWQHQIRDVERLERHRDRPRGHLHPRHAGIDAQLMDQQSELLREADLSDRGCGAAAARNLLGRQFQEAARTAEQRMGRSWSRR